MFFLTSEVLNNLKLYDRHEIGAIHKEKMPSTIDMYLGQRLGINRVIDTFVNKIEAANEEDLVHLETVLDKLDKK